MIKDALANYVIYWLIAVLFMMGPLGIILNNNLMKKVMAMNIMQVAVILFFLVLGQKSGATLPIELAGLHDAASYINPLPHALMLTAIVVSLSTTGVALALLLLMQDKYEVIEEDELLRRMNQ